MRKLLVVLLIALSMGATAQTQDKFTIKLKDDGWMPLSMGIALHAIGAWTSFAAGDLSDPKVRTNFIIFNSVGLGMDVLAFTKFVKKRKKTQPKFL